MAPARPSAAHEPGNHKQHDCPCEGDQYLDQQAGRGMAFARQRVEEYPTDDRSRQTNRDVAEQPKPTAICHPPGEGTSDYSDKDPSQDVVTGDGGEGEKHRYCHTHQRRAPTGDD